MSFSDYLYQGKTLHTNRINLLHLLRSKPSVTTYLHLAHITSCEAAESLLVDCSRTDIFKPAYAYALALTATTQCDTHITVEARREIIHHTVAIYLNAAWRQNLMHISSIVGKRIIHQNIVAINTLRRNAIVFWSHTTLEGLDNRWEPLSHSYVAIGGRKIVVALTHKLSLGCNACRRWATKPTIRREVSKTGAGGIRAKETYRKAWSGKTLGFRGKKHSHSVGVGTKKTSYIKSHGHGTTVILLAYGHKKGCRHVAAVDIENKA